MGIQKILKEKDLHSAQVARKLKVSRSTVARWASGAMRPKKDKLQELATILNVTTDDILDCFVKESV